MIYFLKKIVKNHNFLSLAGNLSASVMNLISFMILIRILNLGDYGRWVLFTTPASMIDLLRLGLTREATVRFMSSIEEKDKKYFIGSSWFVGILTILAISIILWIIVLLFPTGIKAYSYDIFFYYYPLFALSTLPWNYATTILQAKLDFRNIFWIRFFNIGSFLVSIFVVYIIEGKKIVVIDILWVYLLTNVITSLFCIYKGWSGIKFIRYISKVRVNEILAYGKFSMLGHVASSMLKSADSYILSFSVFCGPIGIALYAIPMKFFELLEIPLRSFVSTAFPKLSKASIEKDYKEFKKIFYSYTGSITVLFIIVAFFSILLNKYFILILGGSKFVSHLQGLSWVMIAFIIYGIMLPIDRFTGVALQSLNKPKKNFYKILVMVTANIIGDILAVFYIPSLFPNIQVEYVLLFVAIASIIFTVIGLVVGFNFLKKEVDVNYKMIFKTGFYFYKSNSILLYNKILAKSHKQ